MNNYEKAVNDLLMINSDILVSCSEDQTVIFWNIKTLTIEKINGLYNYENY